MREIKAAKLLASSFFLEKTFLATNEQESASTTATELVAISPEIIEVKMTVKMRGLEVMVQVVMIKVMTIFSHKFIESYLINCYVFFNSGFPII